MLEAVIILAVLLICMFFTAAKMKIDKDEMLLRWRECEEECESLKEWYRETEVSNYCLQEKIDAAKKALGEVSAALDPPTLTDQD